MENIRDYKYVDTADINSPCWIFATLDPRSGAPEGNVGMNEQIGT
jgi:hypothetical protein